MVNIFLIETVKFGLILLLTQETNPFAITSIHEWTACERLNLNPSKAVAWANRTGHIQILIFLKGDLDE